MIPQFDQVKSASRVLDILELLSSSPEPMNTSTVASQLGWPLSSTHALLRTLLARDYLVKNATDAYELGPKVLTLGRNYLHQLDVVDAAHTPMLRMRDICGETISLCVLSAQDVVIVHRSESRKTLRIGNTIGTRLPLHASAMGKALLATWTRDEVEEFFPSPQLERLTSKTITSRVQLQNCLEEIRETGVAYDLEESTQGVWAVAAVIDDGRERLKYALAIVVPTLRAKGEHWARITRLVKAGAEVVSKTMRGVDTVALGQDLPVLDAAYQGTRKHTSPNTVSKRI